MARLIVVLVLILTFASSANAWQPTEIIIDGKALGSGNPMPISINGAGDIVGTYTIITSTPMTWTLTANCTDFTVFNLATNTVWADTNKVATISQCIPVLANGFLSRDAAYGNTVSLVASTPTAVYLVEGRKQ